MPYNITYCRSQYKVFLLKIKREKWGNDPKRKLGTLMSTGPFSISLFAELASDLIFSSHCEELKTRPYSPPLRRQE